MKMCEIMERVRKFEPNNEQELEVALYDPETDESIMAKLKVGVQYTDDGIDRNNIVSRDIDFIEVLEPFMFKGKQYQTGDYADPENLQSDVNGEGEIDQAFNNAVSVEVDRHAAELDDYYDGQRQEQMR